MDWPFTYKLSHTCEGEPKSKVSLVSGNKEPLKVWSPLKEFEPVPANVLVDELILLILPSKAADVAVNAPLICVESCADDEIIPSPMVLK